MFLKTTPSLHLPELKPNIRIPGLIFIPDFVDHQTQQKLVQHSFDLKSKIIKRAEAANVYKSQGHNLLKERLYKLLYVEDGTKEEPMRRINAQHFTNYGDQGHDLTYFIDNKNIPNFVKEALVPRLEALEVVKSINHDGPLNWRLTLNTYEKNETVAQAGFGWHKDIAVNGVVTSNPDTPFFHRI
eukprot:TRINITY_DN1740_c0_g1_i1.p1 TRINITY_DN1740_c0_g1~~TRINITY_DN1740_c0_g1_i1.p1  ORF type:complete len:185 (-),score=46.77 TRINITY_DN1740_c0_g1_i1:260-814(-)